MKIFLKRCYKKVAVPVWKCLSAISRKFASATHKHLFRAEWCVDSPENFDHDIDLYWQWGAKRIAHWLERGIYNILALQIFEKPRVVELCCGEGFNAKYFYSYVAEQVFSCDFDPSAIKEAKRKYKTANVVYAVQDIRNGLLDSVYKNIGRGGGNKCYLGCSDRAFYTY